MSSSTSSSDPTPASARWLWGTLATLLAVGVGCHLLLSRLWADPSEAGGNERTLAVAALNDRTRAVFAGTSHLRAGHPPDGYAVPAVNLPLDGGSYEMLEKVLDRTLSRSPNVRLLVIEFDIVPLRMDTAAMLKGDDRTLWDFGLTPVDVYAPHPLRVADGYVGHGLRPFLMGKPLTPQQLWHDRPPAFCPPAARTRQAGYSPSDTEMGRDAVGVGAAEATSPQLDHRVVARNRAALLRAIHAAKGRGVRVALLTLPYHTSARDQVPAEYKAAVAEVASEVSGSVDAWWDFQTDPRFVTADFRDSTHLNRRGGEKLAGLLRDEVNRLAGGS